MIKNKAVLEVVKGERNYQLIVDNNSPLGELFDVLSEMRSFIFERIKQAEEAEKLQKETPKPE